MRHQVIAATTSALAASSSAEEARAAAARAVAVALTMPEIKYGHDSYKGERQGGKIHGKGVYRWADGHVYEGEFTHSLTYSLTHSLIHLSLTH